ncbi:hypothetical protein JVX91_27990 [Pseudomonas sp. PDNC002]|uniref:hypothetical protein n=1 Tax=Pseudomonas sp. PDNC002 TaxID=2811422 RepID=UPI001964824F|nr:hypothetical protein [Pseudomonas sp. PDNC002]QRY79360.1 hypothetical protein JVX91_27990 [Pseudomonas sp. PDNC002]
MRVFRTPFFLALLSPFVILQTACSSIDRTSEIKRARLSVGASSKNDVVQAIGLPREVRKDDRRNLELWLYTGKAATTSYFIPLPVGSVSTGDSVITYYRDIGPKFLQDGEAISLICVFDSSGHLLDVKRPDQETQP